MMMMCHNRCNEIDSPDDTKDTRTGLARVVGGWSGLLWSALD